MGRLHNTENSNEKIFKGRLFESQPVKKPTLGSRVKAVGKEVVKDPIKTLLVTPAARATEAVTRTVFPNSLATKGYEAMSDAGESQNFKAPILGNMEVKPQKAFGQGGGKQILGETAKTAAYLAPFAKPIASAIKSAPLLGKAGYGAVEGAAFLGGETASQGGSGKDILKSSAIGAGLGFATPLALSQAGRLFKGKTTTKVAEDVLTQEGPVVEKTGLQNKGISEAPLKESPLPTYNTNIPEAGTQKQLPSIKGNRVTSEANRINAKFVKEGLDEIPVSERSTYQGFNEADQIAKVTNYLDNDPNFYKDVANGKVPNDVVPQVAYNAVKRKARATGDIDTQLLLAKSNIASEKSQAASTMRASQVLDDPGDEVEIFRRVNKDLETSIERKLGKPIDEAKKEMVEEIKNQVAKVKVKNQSLEEFISSIKDC